MIDAGRQEERNVKGSDLSVRSGLLEGELYPQENDRGRSSVGLL